MDFERPRVYTANVALPHDSEFVPLRAVPCTVSHPAVAYAFALDPDPNPTSSPQLQTTRIRITTI